MIYLQSDITFEGIQLATTIAKEVAHELRFTNNTTHEVTSAEVSDIDVNPYLYDLRPADGVGFDLSNYESGEYTLEVLDVEGKILTSCIMVLSCVTDLEIFYDEDIDPEVINQIPIIKLEILDKINGEVVGHSYDEKTQSILDSVQRIKEAIEAQGVAVGNDPLRTYADHIMEIDTASPAKITIKQGDSEQSFYLNQKEDQLIEIHDGVTDWDDIQNKPDFKPVATSGSYDDLTDKPEIPSIEGLASEQWVKDQGYLTEHQDISGKVDRSELAPVATSGSYNDLTDKPEIPTVDKHWFGTQEEFDALPEKDPDMIYCIEGQEVKWNDIQNKPDFKPVATSGSYNDLSDKPEIPTVGNGTITINQGGVQKGEFTLNQEGDVTIDLEEGGSSDDKHWFGTQAEFDAIPEKDPDMIYCIEGQDGGNKHWFGTREEYDAIEHDPSVIYHVQEQISYNDLKDKPEIPSIEGLASEQWVEEQGYLTEHQDISGKVDRSELAPVATSGSYDDLTDKPAIPAKTSDLQNDSGFATTDYVDEQIGNINSILENI